jgi:Flp pilus assembly protein TadG
MSIKWPELTDIKNAFLSKVGRKIERFSRNDDGNVAIMFGLTCVVLAVTMGGAIDYMRFNRHKTQLLSAMDAAALALSSHPGLTSAESEQFVEDYVKNMVPNGPDQLFVINGFTVNKNISGYEVVSDAVMETTLLQVIGVTEMELAFSTEVEQNSNHIELALALDNTGSMRSNSKIQALRDAATILVDVMYEADRADERVKVGLVPFVTTVNIKDTTTTGSFDSSWIDNTGQATYNGVNFDDVDPANYPKHHMALYNASGVDWKGCVEARAEPYDTDQTPPGSGDTLFVPFFSPDMDRNMRDYSNDYISEYRPRRWSDPPAPPAHITQRDPSRYYTETVNSYDHYSSGYGPNRGCPRPLVDLTNDTSMLYDEINAMEGWSGGGTNIAMGQFWAWALLDPSPPFSTGRPYTDKDVVKAMVVLTDGENVVTNPGGSTNNSRNINGSDYNGYGFLLKDGVHDGLDRGDTTTANRGTNNRLQGVDNNAAAQWVDTKVEDMCQKIKDEKIRVYTITFQLNDPSQQYLRDLFEDCASDDGYGNKLYYNSPDNATLESVFREIARDLSNLRVVR